MSTALNIPEGFETVGAATLIFQNPSNWKKAEADGVMLQGTYTGLTPVDAYGKQNFQFTATEDGTSFNKDGKEVSFTEGTAIIVNTCASLASKMKSVEIGDEVIVIYQGCNILKKGPFKGKAAHSYNVLKRS